ncbi:MAG: hypothetical protein IT208_12220 [Chthonomonadales bacterium]|nr:hypothetical protein [Chthonomonadales bacterium]
MRGGEVGSAGRLCRYCSKPIGQEERVSFCGRCFAVHHEECWDRNGRCSTFRCPGLPQAMHGDDVLHAREAALIRANQEPITCPLCTGAVYVGLLQGRNPHQQQQGAARTGLRFTTSRRAAAQSGKRGGLLSRLFPRRSWFLAGAGLRARSCGACRCLFLWGVTVDEGFLAEAASDPADRFCPHCGSALVPGEIALRGNPQAGAARFECAEAPDFHTDWLRHNILDRFILNKWPPSVASLPAYSCAECRYTEVAGRPIYRQM